MSHAAIAAVYINTLKYQVFPIRRIFDAGTEKVRCDCKDPECKTVGKHPRVQWTKVECTEDMWRRWSSDGFGVATGARSKIWVLDVDPRSGGLETLSALEQKYGPLPKTVTVTTGSGGTHFYFKYPGPEYRNTAGALGAGLDTRGDGGYVVGPGSLHKSGQTYKWFHGPGDTELAAAPDWLLTLVKIPGKAYTGKGKTGGSAGASGKSGLHAAAPPHGEAEYLLRSIVEDSPTIQWMRENPEDVSREVWRGIAVNLACAVIDHPDLLAEAERTFHDLSAPYSGYKARETSNVFKDSTTVAGVYGPMSFEHMVIHGLPPENVYPENAKNLVHAARLQYAIKLKRTLLRR